MGLHGWKEKVVEGGVAKKKKKREGMSGAKEDPHWGLIMYREVRRRNRFRMVYKEDQLSNGFSQSFQGDPPKLNLSA